VLTVWYARQFAVQIGSVALTVPAVVQDGTDVMEDVPLGDGTVAVADGELFQRPVGYVLACRSDTPVRRF
jgi:hypothetical protein